MIMCLMNLKLKCLKHDCGFIRFIIFGLPAVKFIVCCNQTSLHLPAERPDSDTQQGNKLILYSVCHNPWLEII